MEEQMYRDNGSLRPEAVEELFFKLDRYEQEQVLNNIHERIRTNKKMEEAWGGLA